MSLAVKAALLESQDLGRNERLVLVVIAAHANLKTGNSHPSVATIAEYVGCSERTVQRCLAKLVQLGRLVVAKVAGITTRVYRIVVDAVKGTTPAAPDAAPAATPTEAEEETSAAAPGWRRFLPKATDRRPGYPERRGAALPPDRADQCPRHRGSLAHNCGPCRSEALAGGAR